MQSPARRVFPHYLQRNQEDRDVHGEHFKEGGGTAAPPDEEHVANENIPLGPMPVSQTQIDQQQRACQEAANTIESNMEILMEQRGYNPSTRASIMRQWAREANNTCGPLIQDFLGLECPMGDYVDDEGRQTGQLFDRCVAQNITRAWVERLNNFVKQNLNIDSGRSGGGRDDDENPAGTILVEIGERKPSGYEPELPPCGEGKNRVRCVVEHISERFMDLCDSQLTEAGREQVRDKVHGFVNSQIGGALIEAEAELMREHHPDDVYALLVDQGEEFLMGLVAGTAGHTDNPFGEEGIETEYEPSMRYGRCDWLQALLEQEGLR